MKLSRISFLFLLLFLFVPFSAYSQTLNSKAKKSWTQFYQKFRIAVNNKNRVALKKMMAEEFEGGGSVETPSSYIKDVLDKNNAWRFIQKLAKLQTKPLESNSLITTDNHLVFEFRDGKWLWTAVRSH